MSVELVHEQLSRRIIGSAIVVVNELKPGLDEKLYERALILKLYIRVIRVIRGYILWRLEGDRVRLTDRPKAQNFCSNYYSSLFLASDRLGIERGSR